MFNAIRILDEAFSARKLNYTFEKAEQYEELRVPFNIKNGPSVVLRYISFDRDNDLTVTISNLVNSVPDEKRIKLLETCNLLNSRFRYLKFKMDEQNNLDVQYDFLQSSGDAGMGEMAFEILLRSVRIMNEAYQEIAKALYAADEPTQAKSIAPQEKKDLLEILNENKEGINIRISKLETSGNSENQNPG